MKKLLDNIPLHVNILTIFVGLVVILACSMLYTNHRATSEAALNAADRLLEEISDKISERTARVFDPAFLLADEATLLPDLSVKPDLYGHPSAPLLMKILAEEPSILNAYIGYEDGEFMLMSHIGDVSDKTRMNLKAPQDAHYSVQIIIHRDDGRRVRITKFLDEGMRTMASHIEKDVAYDPRLRPWYMAASKTDRTVLTDLYVYSSSKEVGLTVARRFDGKTSGVFGVDLALSGISRFLAKQRVGDGSHIFIFKKCGLLEAHPDQTKVVKFVTRDQATLVKTASIADVGDPVMNAFYELFTDKGSLPFDREIFSVGGRSYIARAQGMPERYGPDQFLAIIVPLEEFTGPILAAGKQSLLVSLLLLGLFVPAIVLVARRITHPIRILAEEAERIRGFELVAPVQVPSRITEIKHLARSMGAMKSTLASFGMYVPKALVRQIMQNEIRPELGGDRKELTLLFSDIADFTTLSEGMDAELLARKVSTYFTRLGGIILEGGGTIDKFIGDAIMAFWNAPAPRPDHACLGCLAALRCRRDSRALNAEWEAKGEVPMHTRFGLHTAEAIVGNIGSSDRMDYTAMGAAVNLASRLEGLNKHFGTSILASEAVAERCSDRFLFRTVGLVLPKGTLTPTTIFELVGLRHDRRAEDESIAVDQAMEDYCRRWEEAFGLYLKRRWAEAEAAFAELDTQNGGDPVAAVYLERARTYGRTPPDADWTGVETFHTK